MKSIFRGYVRGLTKKLTDWSSSKIELAELQKKCFLEQHNLKMSQMQEKQEAFMRQQEREHDERIQFLKFSKELIKKIIDQ